MLKKLFLFLIGTSTLLGPDQAAAQDTLSLNDAVRIALEKNFSIRIARNNEQIAHNNVTLGNAGFLPELNASGGYNYANNNTRQEFFDGRSIERPNAQSTALQGGIGLNWTIFDGFAMFTNYDQLQRLEEQGELNTMLEVESTVAQIVNAYFTIVRQQQIVDARMNVLALSQERVRLATARADLGSGSGLLRMQAQVDLNADSARLMSEELLLENAKMTLAQLMGEDSLRAFAVTREINVIDTLSEEMLRSLTAQQNLLLRIAENTQELAKLNLKQVEALWYPRLTFNTGYAFNQQQNQAGFLQFNRNTGFNAGITATLNILDFNTARQHENARIAIENSRLFVESLKNQVGLNLAQFYKNYSANLRMLALERQNLEIARRSADIALERLRLGGSAPLEFREAQLAYMDALTRLVTAQFQVKSSETELQRISGQFVRQLR